ncbi:cyclic nucleotide-binding domain-containing protein, partial [Candidatus Sumerlaeota bacterium]|nr:cyclic nucleotide-binding domain-containing protein [Candidatus Sumerlaeota bacterium]
MRLFDGLSSDQIQRLQACAAHMTFEPGSRIFREGDDAMGLFAIISGEVEVTRKTPTAEAVLSYLHDGDTLGELGLIHYEGKRTATATAVARTHIFAIPGNPIRLFEQLKDWGAVLALIKNLVGVIGERMRNKDHNGEIPPAWVGAATVDPEFQRAIRKIKELLPQNPANPFMNDKTFVPGSFLFKEGERPDGFYFIHNGTVQVLKLEGNTV